MRIHLAGMAAIAVMAAACVDSQREAAGPERLVVPVFAHQGHAHSFQTHMTGAEEVPERDTRAQGQTTFKLQADGTVSYKLIVANILDVTQAHIHIGARGTNGPIIVWLYPSAPPAQHIPGRSQGVLAEGVITDDDVVGMLAGEGVAGLLEQVRAGNTYVNVHTVEFPPGEIRGQID
jgi:hypothetical protein